MATITKPKNLMNTGAIGNAMALNKPAAPMAANMASNMSSTTPMVQMGTQTKSPQDNIKPPVATTPQPKVTAPTTATGTVGTGSTGTAETAAANNGLIGSPSALPSYSGLVSKVSEFNPNTDPGVQGALEKQRGFEENYARGQMNRSGQANPFGYQTNLMNINAAGHAALAPVYQSQVQQAYTGAGQRLGALESAQGAAAPRQQGYALLNPFNNAPVGNGSGGGGNLNSLAYWGGGIDASGQLGSQNVGNKVSVQNARTNAQSFIPAAHADPNFNVSPVNAINGLAQAWANNTSNTVTPGLQAQFNNILNQYAQVLGGKDIVTNIIKSANAGSVEALLQSLDQQANTAIQSNASIGGGSGVTAAAPPTTPASPITTPSGGQVHEGDTHVFNKLTYKNINGVWTLQ